MSKKRTINVEVCSSAQQDHQAKAIIDEGVEHNWISEALAIQFGVDGFRRSSPLTDYWEGQSL